MGCQARRKYFRKIYMFINEIIVVNNINCVKFISRLVCSLKNFLFIEAIDAILAKTLSMKRKRADA